MSNCTKGNCINRLIISGVELCLHLGKPNKFYDCVCAIIIKQRRNSNKSTFRQSDYPSHPVPNKPPIPLPLYSASLSIHSSIHAAIHLSICLSIFVVVAFSLHFMSWVWILLARLKLSKLFSHKIQMPAVSVVLLSTHFTNGMTKGYAKQMFSAHKRTHIIRRIYVRNCPSVISAQPKLIAWENEIIWWSLFFVCFIGHWTIFHCIIICTLFTPASSDNFNWMSLHKTNHIFCRWLLWYNTIRIDTWFILFALVLRSCVFPSFFFHAIVFYITFQAVLILVIIPRFSAYCFFYASLPLLFIISAFRFLHTMLTSTYTRQHRTHITTDCNARTDGDGDDDSGKLIVVAKCQTLNVYIFTAFRV